MERIIHFDIEHLDEMGDLCQKTLIVELMGKHSNIIFCSSDGTIIDSIKHVSFMMSSVREVLPGRAYCIPATQEDKLNPREVTEEVFMESVMKKPVSITKAIYGSFTGISPVIANEICYRASIDGDIPVDSLYADGKKHLFHNFSWMMEDVKNHNYCPNIITRGREPIDFSCFRLSEYVHTALDQKIMQNTDHADTNAYTMTEYDSISKVLEEYYATKNIYTRIRQKSVDLRKIVSTALERNRRCGSVHRILCIYPFFLYLLTVSAGAGIFYGYDLEEGAKQLEALNYYTNENVKIPLDPTLDAKANAQKYFDKYGKLKRTYEALTDLIEETKSEIDHLESIATSLDIALTEDDLVQIKEELVEYGYIKRKRTDKKAKIKSKPFHYISSDGYHMYVGKNNYQNEELTFKFATGNDWWFHAKGMPGSHVVVKTNNETDLPNRMFEEAGKLAGYYSSGRDSDKIEIDYLQKKNVKKPNGSAPGFVVYYTNFSLTVHPDISGLTLVE